MNNDLISRSELKNFLLDSKPDDLQRLDINFLTGDIKVSLKFVLNIIDNVPAVKEMEKPFITKCRDTAIEKNLPLYFVYYNETGVLEVYVTETKELFEKRHCSKHLPNYEFTEIVTRYLDDYSDWKSDSK